MVHPRGAPEAPRPPRLFKLQFISKVILFIMALWTAGVVWALSEGPARRTRLAFTRFRRASHATERKQFHSSVDPEQLITVHGTVQAMNRSHATGNHRRVWAGLLTAFTEPGVTARRVELTLPDDFDDE